MRFRGFNQTVINSVGKIGYIKIFRIKSWCQANVIDQVNQSSVNIK